MALSVAIGGGLRLKDTSALYRNQHPRGTGSSGTMICLHLKKPFLDIRTREEMQVGNEGHLRERQITSQHGARCLEPRRAGANLNGMVGALCIALVLSLATVVRGDFRVKFEVEVRSGTKEFTVLVHEDWAPSMPPTARTPD